ncbi:membrane-associated protein, putative [Bodo saltans]|uniref:Membrane-associated protein, putative n=1 Tax=Bodo saltans TaxID=75058 RepID=A0A0S4JIR7_BODSA|nr:membrane-associated protein, putative [Bodo saltans]|eukprot:CUG91407.1 membrane-associated protein, putative [Bodo saltans]
MRDSARQLPKQLLVTTAAAVTLLVSLLIVSPAMVGATTLHTLVCPANATAGTELACILQVSNGTGVLYGDQTCLASLRVCGSTSASRYLTNSTFRGVGLFRFTFVPTVSGYTNISATYNGTSMGSATVYVSPAAFVLKASSSSCAAVNATSSACTTYWKDRFGNVAKTCTTSYNNAATSAGALSECQVL